MNKKNFHVKFDPATMFKLQIYRLYLREWLPVFLQQPLTVQIFDFFAGPGQDEQGVPGSPRITIEEIAQALVGIPQRRCQYKAIKIFWNELDKQKHQVLLEYSKNFSSRFEIDVTRIDFNDLFDKSIPAMEKKNVANLVFIDPYGISALSKERFLTLANMPRTDLLFYCSSAICNRMKKEESIYGKVPYLTEEVRAKLNGDNVHKTICECYKKTFPKDQQYFLGSFSIKRKSNTNGLIFGSAHPLGIEKFLKVVWDLAPENGGDGNFDIHKHGGILNQPFLFSDWNKKIQDFTSDIEMRMIKREFMNNHDLYIYTLENSMLPKHTQLAIKNCKSKEILLKKVIPISYDAFRNESLIIPYNDFYQEQLI